MLKQHLWMSRADRRTWRSATSLADLGQLTARWLEGTLASQPGYAPNFGPDAETTQTPGLVRVLALCNRSGYVTECSQPGQLGPDWYLDRWAQREAVSGIVDDPDVLTALRQAAERHGLLYVEHHPDTPDGPRPEGIVVTTYNGQVWTRFGDWMPPDAVRFRWKGAGGQAVAAAERAWQVTLANPDSGPSRLLLTALVEAFAEPDVARCVRCGCTEDDPCPGGCAWVPELLLEDLCSNCAVDHLAEQAAAEDGADHAGTAGPGPVAP
ncbi:hypothetical protein [Kitasatospora sp. NBC_01300]|uniref:DUF6919 domain-containing protein n=1 Tax=Kitasatospora sp. NBC_01300 TaxID=2903574 RepID=UPI002F914771|nr:hypothetical protein OG556_40240 [Kitasatospora sp. NBC_01300]